MYPFLTQFAVPWFPILSLIQSSIFLHPFLTPIHSSIHVFFHLSIHPFSPTGVPVVVTDGTKNWTAPEVFNFKFFKGIYKNNSPALDNYDDKCQFFPYRTNFNSLRDVFNMSDERAQLKDGTKPWYIGW